MSARGRGRGGDGGHDNEERWLLTYADMITLLMALFIVMWAISSVNISKFNQLKASLKSAFSAKVLPANDSIMPGQSAPFQQDGTPVQPISESNTPSKSSSSSSQSASSSVASILTVNSIKGQIEQNIAASMQAQTEGHDVANLVHIQEKVEQYAAEHGLEKLVKATIDERGLVIRLLTDKVLFASGQAHIEPAGIPLLTEISGLLARADIVNPVRVEGNTDDETIHSGLYPSNWELSSARANAVLQVLLAHGVAPKRLSSTGYGEVNPVTSNATPEGRATNRRVELVILRRT